MAVDPPVELPGKDEDMRAGLNSEDLAVEEEEARIDPDQALLALGRWNRHSVLIYVATNFVVMLQAFQVMQMAFVSGVPDFACRAPTADPQPPLVGKVCRLVLDNATDALCGTNDSRLVFDTQDFGRTIVSDFGLVCGQEFYSELPGSMFMTGMLFGAIVITQLSDRIGRRPTLLGGCVGFFVFSALTSLSPSVGVYTVLRFLCGFFNAGVGMVAWVLCCENITVYMRPFATVMGGMCWTSGYLITGLVAYYVRHWNHLAAVLAAPLVLTALFYWLLPESLHWLVANNRVADAKDWLARASRMSGVKVTYDGLVRDGKVQTDLTVRKRRSVVDIFAHNPVLALQTLLMAYIWINSSLVYYALSIFSTRLAGNKYVNYLLSGLVEIPAAFIAPLGMHFVGRRPVAVVFFATCGVSLIAMAALPPTGQETLTICLNLLGKLSISTAFNCIFLYIVELFPTTVRNVGGGFCSMAARFGAILAPYTGVLGEVDPDIPPYLFGGMSLLAAVCALAMPETRGKKLPEDVHDALVGPLLRLCFPKPRLGLAPVKTDASKRLLIPSDSLPDTASKPKLQNLDVL